MNRLEPSDPLFMVERDFGKIGTEIIGYREYSRSKIVDMLAFEWTNAIRVLELREDECRCEDITEEIFGEAELMREERASA